MKTLTRRLSFAAFALILSLFIFTGASCPPQGSPEEAAQVMALWVEDARELGELGTLAALDENEGFRTALNHTLTGLRELEKQPDPITLDSLTAVLKRIPVDELKTIKARIFISSGRILLRRVGGRIVIVNLGNARPIVTALREGMEAGLQQ